MYVFMTFGSSRGSYMRKIVDPKNKNGFRLCYFDYIAITSHVSLVKTSTKIKSSCLKRGL